jgi:DUF2075 family protein/DNA replication protein DnaC
MTEIYDIDFDSAAVSTLKSAAYTKDWPVVYLLENDEEIYVGETVSAYNRLRQHSKNAERRKLRFAHIIVDNEFNKSASLDIESWLIQYMAADERFTLQNGNKGLSEHSYYDRDKYRAKFELLWSELQKKGLAGKDLIQLRNSDIFKYSPYKALTEEQMSIVKSIEDDISKHDYKTYLVNGDPGTGKSVLATFLAKYLTESKMTPDIKIALVIPMTSLRSTLQRVFRKVKGLSASMVIAPNQVMGNQYDLLIVDEAHRLRQRKNLSGYGPFDKANKYYDLGNDGTQLDWILRASKSQIFMYDENQSVMPGDIPKDLLQKLPAHSIRLTSQLRVLGGNDYIQFIDDVLNMRPAKTTSFPGYELKNFKTARDLIKEIKCRDEEYGLARTVAGYAWDWKTGKGTGEYDIELDGLKLIWNSVSVDWVNSPNAVNEIGCIHTVQGYDLNYVGVIIGPELRYDKANHKIIIDKAKYKDVNGKRSLESDEELERYIVNIYKTLLTRGIHGTYIYAVDDALNDYFHGYIAGKKASKK